MLLEDQDRSLWNHQMINEGLALIDKAMRHRRPGAYQVQAAIAGHEPFAARLKEQALGIDRTQLGCIAQLCITKI